MRLIVKSLDDRMIGTVTQKGSGNLEISGATPELESALKQLIQAISANPVPYRQPKIEREGNDVRHITVLKLCRQGDRQFLRAIKDVLPHYKLLGIRIAGVIE